MRKRPLLLLACVFLTGIAYQRYFIPQLWLVLLVVIVWDWKKSRQFKKIWKRAGRSILLLSAFLIGIFQMQQEETFRAAYMSKIADGSRITVWGKLIKLETMEYGNRGILSDCYIDFGEGIVPSNDIMVYASTDQYQIGQIHKINGKVNMFSRARNEGNFDSYAYYQSLKIDFAVYEEESKVLENELDEIETTLLSLREQICSTYNHCLSEKAAGFYRAMVLGDKTSLEEPLKNLFLLGGISHILAISGLHVSMIGRGIYRFLRRCGIGFGIAGICGSVMLMCYCAMVGKSISTIRAVGMLMLFFLSQWMGRSYDMLNALGGMVLFLLWENPFLIENSGFWFSVTALFGVGVVGQELSQRISEKKKIRQRKIKLGNIWMSIGITLMTMPITALVYYEIPIYAFLVNFVVLPLLTPIFCLAVLVGLLGVIFPIVNIWKFMLLPCEWLLSFYEWVCHLVSKLPFANIICGRPTWWQVMIYYGVLLGGVYILRSLWVNNNEMWLRKRNIVRSLLVGICILCIFFPRLKPFEITFLDVGQGDGIYISAGDGTTYFIDGGSSSVNKVGEYRILPFLKAKSIGKIDYWFVSHCDMDHISGLLEILEKDYKIEHIVLHEHSSSNEMKIALMETAKKKGIEVLEIAAGDRICSKYMEFTCIAPLAGNESSKDLNENSLVLKMDWSSSNGLKDYSALFAGDISTETETMLCQRGVFEEVDLFKANHHGSNYSNGALLLEKLSPKYIVVSCGENNVYGHPGKDAVKRMEESGAEIFYTMDGGQITFPLIQ